MSALSSDILAGMPPYRVCLVRNATNKLGLFIQDVMDGDRSQNIIGGAWPSRMARDISMTIKDKQRQFGAHLCRDDSRREVRRSGSTNSDGAVGGSAA
jgi:hypothetical protein